VNKGKKMRTFALVAILLAVLLFACGCASTREPLIDIDVGEGYAVEEPPSTSPNYSLYKKIERLEKKIEDLEEDLEEAEERIEELEEKCEEIGKWR
jgi:prefoldin subunit 5